MTKVLVNFIQDRSGSMATVWSETLSGFKAFVADLKQKGAVDGISYSFTLTTFDTLIELPIKAAPITDVDEDALAKLGPRGSTALYDAVGKTLDATSEDADKIICVIVTDGQENSSREWSKDAVHSAIDAKIKTGKWTFTYLGTQPETWDDATSIGIGVGATANYVPQNAAATYAVMSNAIHNLSKSSDWHSDNLMSSAYTSQGDARAAGMTITPDPNATITITPSAKPVSTPKKSKKSWRSTVQ